MVGTKPKGGKGMTMEAKGKRGGGGVRGVERRKDRKAWRLELGKHVIADLPGLSGLVWARWE